MPAKKTPPPPAVKFVQLTKQDGSPIWINASFIVTVEKRRAGGSVVVPVGDGLDYDVREEPEAVIAAADGAPVPVVVPVPTTDALVTTPAKKRRKKDEAENAEAPKAEPPAEQAPEQAPAGEKQETPAEKSAEENQGPVMQPDPRADESLFDEEVLRLRRMAPRTVKKLQNTLLSQFKVSDAGAAIRGLEKRGAIKVDGVRIQWI